MKYFRIVVVLAIIAILIYIVIGFIAMDKGVGHYQYSNSLDEAKKEGTLISEYLVYKNNKEYISNAWLEYGRTYDIFDNKKIEKDRVLLNIKKIDSRKINNGNIYWEAFFKNKKLTAFEDKGIIGIIGIIETMDTITLKPNKNDIFYIIKK